jgi:hypothetical protein
MALSISCSFTSLAEGLPELSLIVLVAGDPGHRIADAGRAHLKRICDRQRSLLL